MIMFEPLTRFKAMPRHFSGASPWAANLDSFRPNIFDIVDGDQERANSDTDGAAFADGYAAGYAAAQADHAAIAERNSAAFDRIAASLSDLSTRQGAIDPQLFAHAIARMLTLVVGETVVEAPTLRCRTEALLAVVADETEAKSLHCNPDDAVLLGTISGGLTIVADTRLPRGSVRVATGQGWIDDRIEDRLARVTAALLGGAMP